MYLLEEDVTTVTFVLNKDPELFAAVSCEWTAGRLLGVLNSDSVVL